MKNLTIIIPVHKYNKDVDAHLKNAIKSIEVQDEINKNINLLLVGPKKIEPKIEKINISEDNINKAILINDGDTSYQNQINLAVQNIKTDYFTVLEFDDEISNTYIKNVNEYIENYPDMDVFMSLIVETNKNNEAIKLTNESVWSKQNMEENDVFGLLSMEIIKNISDFKLSGAVIKTESFKKIGGYKTKIKLTFMHEYLLRSLHNNHKITTIPKVIYKHLMDREDSLLQEAMNNTVVSERRFWFETAEKEYLFNDDRDIDLSNLHK